MHLMEDGFFSLSAEEGGREESSSLSTNLTSFFLKLEEMRRKKCLTRGTTANASNLDETP